VSVMPSAHATIGNANANNAKTTARLILVPSHIFLQVIHPGVVLQWCGSFAGPGAFSFSEKRV
jgi:hypothetical protein